MSRSQRLLDLIQVLRRHRRAVSGAVLAEEVGVSLRTLYRDIETLRAQGAPIDGEVGVGYMLRPGFMLPPLMFSEEEIEALVLGSRWVSERADGPLGKAARNVLAKIGAVLPDDLKQSIDASGLLIGPGDPVAAGDARRVAAARPADPAGAHGDELRHHLRGGRSRWPPAARVRAARLTGKGPAARATGPSRPLPEGKLVSSLAGWRRGGAASSDGRP